MSATYNEHLVSESARQLSYRLETPATRYLRREKNSKAPLPGLIPPAAAITTTAEEEPKA